MLILPTPSSSPTRITSSPSLSSEPSTEPTFEPQPLPDVEYHVPSPNESPLHAFHSHRSDEGSLKLNELTNLVTKLSERIGVLEDDLKKIKQTYSSAFTKLILRIKKLESKVKTRKAKKRARVVLSEDEEDDSSKQGRIDKDPNTYFHQDNPNTRWGFGGDDGGGVVVAVVAAAGDGGGPTVRGGSGCDGDEGGGEVTRLRQPERGKKNARFCYYNNGMFTLNLNKVLDDSGSVYMSSSTVVNFSLWHARLGHVHYKRMLEMFKDDLIPAIDENTEKYEALNKFRIYKAEVELKQNVLIKTLRIDRGGEYYDLVFFQSIRIIHETTSPYTPQQNGVVERKNKALKEMVNSMVPNKRNKTTLYELWYKKRPSLSFLRDWGCKAIVRLPDPKRKTLGEKGTGCIFVGYAEHSMAYRFYVIEANDYVSINTIIESIDAIFDENRFSSIPRHKDIIPNSDESQMDDHSNVVPSETPKPRKDVIDDEIGSIMEHNTWVLSDLPPGCKWIFKRKMKVDGAIDKFKA
ncbi:zinc finger, CCHC-type containing protein [Tanacetum coccineum]